ncbi:MAG: Flp pilus assembly complex ATPase component TadA [Zoogloeaceae bacterium]|jgi:general secretion pathway protein E|nr:Flp pilus assembly complex ATPase component TadA [Zoogloeaceae bacterium]
MTQQPQPSSSRPFLGELLMLRAGLEPQGLESALRRKRQGDEERLGALLIRLGLISEQTLLAALSEQLQVPVLDERSLAVIAPRITAFHARHPVSLALAQRLAFVAWEAEETPDATDAGMPPPPLHVAARDILDSTLIEYLESGPAAGRGYRHYLIAARDLERMLAQLSRRGSETEALTDLRRLAEDAPIVELVNGTLARATDTRASDVHFEPEEFGFVVRYRIDGQLQATEHYPRERFDAVVSRIKLISGLDIAERRLPQDGRFSSRMAGVDTDVRVSVIPSVQGESLVLRLLPNIQGKRFDLENSGMEADHLAIYRRWMCCPDGIVLVTGPTGSGKSTTLYATLTACDTEHERILTVEDPVEYQIPGVTQFQVHPDIGFTFPSALRSILRHDPDTIMIGEIRDAETAGIAVQASLTGHRVFSTLHTNDSPTAFLRLADMGVEPFLVGATVRGVVAQRLVRRLCPACAAELPQGQIPAEVRAEVERLGVANPCFRSAHGCDACSHTGYKGRIAIYELLEANDALRAALNQLSPSLETLAQAANPDFRTLREDGLIKAAKGITSLEEVLSAGGQSSPLR